MTASFALIYPKGEPGGPTKECLYTAPPAREPGLLCRASNPRSTTPLAVADPLSLQKAFMVVRMAPEVSFLKTWGFEVSSGESWNPEVTFLNTKSFSRALDHKVAFSTWIIFLEKSGSALKVFLQKSRSDLSRDIIQKFWFTALTSPLVIKKPVDQHPAS